MAVEHVFFDLDHTLWDFEKNSTLTFQQIFETEKLSCDVNDFLRVYPNINFDYWKLYREDKITKEALRYGRLKDTFDSLKIPVSNDLIHFLSEEYIRVLPTNNHLFDGAVELLDYLKPKYQLHIITNGFEEVQQLKLAKSGIKDYFNHIITSEAVGVKKPNPKVFLYSLQVAGTTANKSVMIGDNLEADIYGALHCGIRSIHYNLEGLSVEAATYQSVSSLIEIKQYL